MASLETPKFIADGTIRPCRFVKNTGDFQCKEADAGEEVIGVSQEAGRAAPISDVTTINAAESGDQLIVYGDGQICLLELGGTVTIDQYIKSDADGKGVASTTDLENVGARCLQAGVSGDKVSVLVHLRERSIA